MTTPLMQPGTKRQLQPLQQQLPQSLVLQGEVGIGLFTIAKWLADLHQARQIIVLPTDNDGRIDQLGGSIGVDQIRALYGQTTHVSKTLQVVIIRAADHMSLPAQNTFLKLLEEPSLLVRFMLLVHDKNSLLPTIRSRVQTITVDQISQADSIDYLQSEGISDPKKLQQMLFIASGRPGLLHKVVHEPAYFEARASQIRDARQMLQSEPYQALQVIQRYRSDRDEALRLVEDMSSQLMLSLRQNPDNYHYIEHLSQILAAYQQIKQNGSIRLNLLALVV